MPPSVVSSGCLFVAAAAADLALVAADAAVWSQYTACCAFILSCGSIAAGADLDLGLVAADSVGPRPPHPSSSPVAIIGTLISD